MVNEIEKFENGLTREQEEYLDKAYGGSHTNKDRVVFPFLKSCHKIHKMSEEEIRNKDLSNLKFRPVVDAKYWLTRGYSGVVMQMMREACNMIVESGGTVMRKMKPKDGWRFAVDIHDYNVEEEFDIMLTGDLQEAYSNVTDKMIKKAIDVVSGFVGFKKWTIELMKQLVDLVLGQNYVETSGGIFKFKKVLPMGYSLSGEALDLVALAEEMVVLYHLGNDGEKARIRIREAIQMS